MKKVIAAACIGTSVVFLSCGTTATVENTEPEVKTPIEEVQIEETKIEEIKVDPIQAAFDDYSSKIEGLTLSIASTPKEVFAEKSFASPFSVKATKADGSAFAGLELIVTYPAEKTNGVVTFATQSISTAEDGIASFNAPKTAFACASSVTFEPAGDKTNEKIAELIAAKAVKTDYKVKTNKMAAGGSIALIDFTKSGKPISGDFATSSNLLMTLMKKGFVRIGNAPYMNDVAYGTQETVYKSAKKLFGSTSAFLVYGTVKYASDVEKVDGGYRLTITADVTALNMKDGSSLYKTTKTITATDTKDWSVITQARKKLADELASELFYNL